MASPNDSQPSHDAPQNLSERLGAVTTPKEKLMHDEWREEPFEIYTWQGVQRIAGGWRRGCFGIDQRANGFSVTHLPTGRRIAIAGSLQTAKDQVDVALRVSQAWEHLSDLDDDETLISLYNRFCAALSERGLPAPTAALPGEGGDGTRCNGYA